MVTQIMKTQTSNSYDSLKQKLEYIKSVIDPGLILQSLGFIPDRDNFNEIRCKCLIHGGDNNSAFRFNKNTNTWVCFTKKCHEGYSNDVIGLVQAVRRCSFIEAISYLEDLIGGVGEFSGDKLANFKLDKEIDKLQRLAKKSVSSNRLVAEDILAKYKKFKSRYFKAEGFSEEILNHFEVCGGYTDEEKVVRDIIPIRDVNGKLVAYSLRDTRKGVSEDNKYKLTSNFDKDRVLYNLDKTKTLFAEKPMIIVEGFKSVWRLKQYGIDNVVAIMGSRLTVGQTYLVEAFALKGVILLFDNDLAGIDGTVHACNDLKNSISPIKPIFITETDVNGKGLDPSDLSKDEIMNYLGCYI